MGAANSDVSTTVPTPLHRETASALLAALSMGIVVLLLRAGEDAPRETAIVRSVPVTADRLVMTLSVPRDRGAVSALVTMQIVRSVLSTIDLVVRATNVPRGTATVPVAMTAIVLAGRPATVRATTEIARSALLTIGPAAKTGTVLHVRVVIVLALTVTVRSGLSMIVPVVSMAIVLHVRVAIARATTEIARSVPTTKAHAGPLMTVLAATTESVRLAPPVSGPRSHTVIGPAGTTAIVRLVPRAIVRVTTEIAPSAPSMTVPVDTTESVPRVRAATVPMDRADDRLDPMMAAVRVTATIGRSATTTATVDHVAKTIVRVVKNRHPIALAIPLCLTRSPRSTCTLPRGTSSRR